MIELAEVLGICIAMAACGPILHFLICRSCK
jgi:hypothetical protein